MCIRSLWLTYYSLQICILNQHHSFPFTPHPLIKPSFFSVFHKFDFSRFHIYVIPYSIYISLLYSITIMCSRFNHIVLNGRDYTNLNFLYVYMFNFLRSCQTGFKSGYSIPHSHRSEKNVPVFLYAR